MFGRLFNSFKPSANMPDLLHTTDLHSHLIPGIDDGSSSLEQSIDLLKSIKSLGFKKIITTPHIMSHRFPNTKQNILEGYNLLKDELKAQNIDIQLEVGAVYYYDEHFLELIKKDELLTFGDNYILFELSYHNKPFGLEQTVHTLLSAGYKPIIAHPERYTYYTHESDYRQLKDMGLLFQINAISTVGFYGKNIQKTAEKLIKLGLVSFVGSDIHSQKYALAFEKALKSKIYNQIFTNNQIINDYL